MADKTIHQIISAFTSGCLDKENYIQFLNYVMKDGDLPKGEMGELQNIVSLIPLLLEPDKPSVAIKNSIAQRILEIEEAKKATVEKVTSEKDKKEATKEDQHVNIQTSEINVPEEVTDVKRQTFIEDPIKPQAVNQKEKTKIKSEPLHQIQEGETPTTKIMDAVRHPNDNSKSFRWLPWVLSILLVIILLLVTFYFNSINTKLEGEVESIKTQLSDFQNEISSTNKFVNDHIELIQFFNHKNVEIVNFQGSEANLEAWGKLLISFEAGEGLLQLKNISALSSNEVYQLWMVSATQSYSLGTIVTRPEIEYYKIKNIPFLKKDEIRMFRITREMKGGAEIPQGTTYLFGVFSTEKLTAKGNRR